MTSDYEALARYFSRPITQGSMNSSAADIAKHILLNAQTTKPLGPGMLSGGGDSGPSLMGRVFDVLSRGNYASAEFVRDWAETGSPHLDAAWQGLSGKKKTTFADSLQQMGMEKGPYNALAGLVLDVGADPLSYVPVAGIANKVKGALKGAGEVTDLAALERPLGQRLLNEGQPLHPENFNLPANEAQSIPGMLQRPPGEVTFPRQVTDINPTKPVLPADKLPAGLQDQLPFDLTQLSPKGTKLRTPKEIAAGQLDNAALSVGPVKEVPGQIPLKFPDFTVKGARATTKAEAAKTAELVAKLSESAPEHVAKVAAQDVQAAMKLTPLPPPHITPKHAAIADKLTESFNPSLSKAELNKKYPDSLNAQQQARLWHSSRSLAARDVFRKGKSKSWIDSKISENAIKIYSRVEQNFIEKGLVPRIGTGENVKFSDVIAHLTQQGKPITDDVVKEFSTEIKPGSDIWKAVETLRARGAINEASSVKLISDKIAESQAVTKASGTASDAQMKDFESFLKKFGEATARAEGLSPASIQATRSLIDATLKSGKTPAQLAVEQNAKMIDDIIATGKANPKVNGLLTRALEKDLGTIPSWAVNDNKGMESFMGRVATWWGQNDLRPMSLNAIGAAQATAATRGHVLDKMFEGTTDIMRSDALNLAKGIGTGYDAATVDLAHSIQRTMDNLVGQVSGSSVLLRSGVSMDMLNKWMRQYKVGMEFTNSAKVTDHAGKVIDYSKGTDWVNSWKTAEITDDPKLFIFKAQQAMEQATREKALFDEMGERFGSTFPGKAFRTKVTGFPYIEGYYFPKEIADQIPRVVRDWSIPAWKGNSPLLQQYDRVLSMWKAGVTIYRPAHHLRNMAGDIYLGWMDGVNSLRPYMLAARVQRSMKGAYETMADVDQLIAVGAMKKGLGTPKPNEILFHNKSGVPFTAEQIGAVAHQKGILEHAKSIEDIIDLGDQGRKSILNIKPFNGKVQNFARGASELQSHNARLAHFIDVVYKSKGKDIATIFENAARRSRKWHPTGLDLTQFEKKTMRRIMPFYAWMRKSLPLLLEGMVMNPGKSVIPAKFYDALQINAGIDTPGRDNPFPVDQMFPSWIRAQGVGPISAPDGMLAGLSNQQPAGYVMAGIGLNPLQDLVSQLQTPDKTILTSLTPGVQIPMELLTGKKSFTGEPITGVDARPGALQQYIGEQIPVWATAQQLTGMTPFGTDTKNSGSSDGQAQREAFVNFMTGAGIKGTGSYIGQARYEKKAPVQMQRKIAKEDFLSQLRSQLGGN